MVSGAWGALERHKKLAVFVVLILAGAFYYGFRDTTDNSSGEASQAQTQTVKRGDITVDVTATGQVYAKDQVDLRPQVAGDGVDVVQVAVRNGQEVKEGDLIAVLDSSDAQDSVRNAELSLWGANIKMDQTEDMYETKTKEDRQARQLQEISVSQAANNLSEAQKNLQDYSVRAPFDGVVADISVSAGDSISRDETLASIITKDMYAKVTLNEVDAVKVSEGDAVTLTFDALPNMTATGKVTHIDTIGTVDQGVVYFDAEISIDDSSEALRPGMSVSADITAESKENVLTVPASAVHEGTNGSYVYTARSGAQITTENILETPVETGISNDTSTEITGGLKEGDIIVTKLPSSSSAASASTSSNSSSSGGGFLNFGGPGGGR